MARLSAVRRFRLARHPTIEGFALDTGMCPTYLSGIERGLRNPAFSKLADLTGSPGGLRLDL